MPLRVTNITRGKILADRAREASGFVRRFVGWMGRRRVALGDGLHLIPCDGIHTFFMRFAIDAVFLDREGGVLHLKPALAPWRASAAVPGARSVLELPSGVIAASGTTVGDRIAFERLPDVLP